MREVGIGIAGFGTVAGGALSILRDHAGEIESRLGARIAVRHIAVRNPDKKRVIEVDRSLITTRYQELLEDPRVAVVVELVGGVEVAFDLVMEALKRGKHVVTANKTLLACRGDEIFRLAVRMGVDIYYEGAVCGGIPIIRTLREALASDRIQGLRGIVNGTTNFILTAVEERGESVEKALGEAQRLGYAEVDPTLDVSGGDAAQKLCLLAQLAFGARLQPEDVLTEGIMRLSPEDFRWGRELGYALKLLAIARRCPNDAGGPDQIEARVHPAFIPADSLLAGVRGAFNAVQLQSDALGPSMLFGQGAGAMPTGSAVVSDIIDLTRNILANSPGRVSLPPEQPLVSLRPHDDIRCAYYLHFAVKDVPGVLALIASALAARHISIAAVQQKEHREEGGPVPLVIVTHLAREADLRNAIQEIDRAPSTVAPTRFIRIEA